MGDDCFYVTFVVYLAGHHADRAFLNRGDYCPLSNKWQLPYPEQQERLVRYAERLQGQQ
ncbi:hypothetical protein [Micromonospora musae]|uniref:hypothetical protein n=1 Tax=Micromonospora musae TaxID=1894970 RepID=UPI003434A5B6